jgi:hypothetical protein
VAEIRTFDVSLVVEEARVSSWEQARATDPTIRATLRAGGTAEDCCVLLLAQLDTAYARMRRLESITPRKFRLPDGRLFVWHCPDDLVPESWHGAGAAGAVGKPLVTIELANGCRLELRGDVDASGDAGQPLLLRHGRNGPVRLEIAAVSLQVRSRKEPAFADATLGALCQAAREEGADGRGAALAALADLLGECAPADRLEFVRAWAARE